MANRMGRPSKITPEIVHDIVQRVQAGVHPEVAAKSCGIGEATYYRWVSKGEHAKKGSLFREFRELIEEAVAFAEASLVLDLRVQSKKKEAWRMLGLRFKERWGLSLGVDVQHGLTNDLAALLKDQDRLRGHDPRALPLAEGEIIDITPLHLPESVKVRKPRKKKKKKEEVTNAEVERLEISGSELGVEPAGPAGPGPAPA